MSQNINDKLLQMNVLNVKTVKHKTKQNDDIKKYRLIHFIVTWRNLTWTPLKLNKTIKVH